MHRFIAVAAASVALLGTLSGCLWEVGLGRTGPAAGTPSAQFTLSGTVTGTPITGSLQGLVSLRSTADPACAPDGLPFGVSFQATVTLTDEAGSVTKEERLCASPDSLPTSLILTGQYTVTGGTGRYAGAVGSGSTTLQILNTGSSVPFEGAFIAQEIGTFELPGLARVAAAKRTFRTRGTLSVPDPCNAGRRQPPSARPRQHCGSLTSRLSRWSLLTRITGDEHREHSSADSGR